MINEIIQSNVLPEDVEGLLPGLTQELQETLNTVQRFRTRTEMEISVLADLKFPSPAAKYWQAVREQSVMYQELIALSFEYKRNVIRRKQKDAKMRRCRSTLKKQLLEIDINELDFRMDSQRRTAEARLMEIRHWSQIKRREWLKMSEFERKNPDNHQLISYTRRWINNWMAMGNGGTPSERYNLMCQLQSGLNMCIQNKVMDEVTEGFPQETIDFIMGRVMALEG